VRRTTIGIIAALGATLLLVPAAQAATPIAPYDGSIPFRCKVQNVGTGVDYPDPGADPFCVEFDKTNQNVTDFGIVDFLLNEPARVAAATPKCFYHQTDHWTGWIEQGTGPVLWHWDGKYFFDKARGMGGVHVENFTVGGIPVDPRTLPGFPPEYSAYFAPGGGGVMVATVAADPRCAERVDTSQEASKVYRPGWR
jgi:hypothetical protein